jgi:hypothetical protein
VGNRRADPQNRLNARFKTRRRRLPQSLSDAAHLRRYGPVSGREPAGGSAANGPQGLGDDSPPLRALDPEVDASAAAKSCSFGHKTGTRMMQVLDFGSLAAG